MNFFQFTIGNYCAGIILHHPIIPDFTTVVSLLIGLIMSYIIFIHNTKNETVMLILDSVFPSSRLLLFRGYLQEC